MSDCQRAWLGVGCIHHHPSAAQAGRGWPWTMASAAQWPWPVLPNGSIHATTVGASSGFAEPLEEPVCQRGVLGHGLWWVLAVGLSGVSSGCSWACGVDQGLDDPRAPAPHQGSGG